MGIDELFQRLSDHFHKPIDYKLLEEKVINDPDLAHRSKNQDLNGYICELFMQQKVYDFSLDNSDIELAEIPSGKVVDGYRFECLSRGNIVVYNH